jgi:site-specific recombinase XerD
MTPPKVPVAVVPVVPEESLTKLIGCCRGDSFADRRDAALLRLFASTGARRSELLELRVSETRPEENDVDLDMGVARVRGKGGRHRLLPLGPKAARALDRYLRARARHPDAHQPWLWLGKRGKLTMNGVRHIFDKRAAAAGLGRVHPHQLRHSFAHHYLSNGGNETDLQRIAGWRSPEMLRRYGESAAQGRALENSKKVGLDDRI